MFLTSFTVHFNKVSPLILNHSNISTATFIFTANKTPNPIGIHRHKSSPISKRRTVCRLLGFEFPVDSLKVHKTVAKASTKSRLPNNSQRGKILAFPALERANLGPMRPKFAACLFCQICRQIRPGCCRFFFRSLFCKRLQFCDPKSDTIISKHRKYDYFHASFLGRRIAAGT